jgi:hypothetical protein
MRKGLILLAATALMVTFALPAAATTPSDVAIEVESSLLGQPGPFTASGSAVDDGLICDSGLVYDLTGKASGFSPTGFNFSGIKGFDCADGSGGFAVNLQARIDFRKGVSFSWNVIDGVGAYEKLHGAGSGFGIPGVPCGNPNECILDVYDGGLHVD